MVHGRGAWAAGGVWAAALALLVGAEAPHAASVPLSATLVDRQGNAYQVEKLTLNGREQIEYYVAGQRRVVSLRELSRIRFEGEAGQEEQPLTVVWPTGRSESGKVPAGASLAAHEDAIGGGGVAMRFAGNTSLGPFSIMVSEVREVVLTDAGAVVAEAAPLRATLVTEEGRRFDLTNIQYRSGQRLTYWIGQHRRFADLAKVAQIDFAEGSATEEMRPVTITYWDGKSLQATVESGRVRLSGETDRVYHDRVNAAWTGRTGLGGFAVGMHAVRQVPFKAAGEPEDAAAEPQADQQQAPSPAAATYTKAARADCPLGQADQQAPSAEMADTAAVT